MKVYLKADEEPWIFIGNASSVDFHQNSLSNMSLNDFLRYRENLQPICYIDLKRGDLNNLYELAEQSKHIYQFELLVISESDEKTAALFTFDTLKGWQNVFGEYTICFTPLAQTNDVSDVLKQIENQ